MNKELFEKFITLAKEKGFAPNLDEVNYETAKQLTELNKKQNEKESNCIINYTGLRFDCLQAGTKERGKYGKRNEAKD